MIVSHLSHYKLKTGLKLDIDLQVFQVVMSLLRLCLQYTTTQVKDRLWKLIKLKKYQILNLIAKEFNKQKKKSDCCKLTASPPTTPTSARATTPSPTTSTPSPSSGGKTTTCANCSHGYNRRRDKSWCKKPATYRSPNPQPTLKKSQP